MGWEGIAAIAACIALVFTILGVVFVFGKIVSRLESLEARVKEDRDKNDDQHKKYDATTSCAEGLEIKVSNVEKVMEEVRLDLKKILERLPDRRNA